MVAFCLSTRCYVYDLGATLAQLQFPASSHYPPSWLDSRDYFELRVTTAIVHLRGICIEDRQVYKRFQPGTELHSATSGLA